MNKKDVNHILMLSNTFFPLPPGGAERQAEHLSAYLSQHNIQVTVLTRHAPKLKRQEIKDGYSIIRIPEFGYGKIKTLTFVIGAIWTMLFKIKTFDILHAHLVYSPAFAAVIVGKLLGKRTIVRFRSSGAGSDLVNSHRNIHGLFRMAFLKRWADCFIVLTQEMQDELINAGYRPERIKLMDNGVDTDYYIPSTTKKELKVDFIPEDKVLILFTGRLHPSKNLPLLLNALKKAVTQCPSLFLLIVGDGDEMEALVNLTKELGLELHVKFAGSALNVRDYLQAADIFVLPSLDEGISNSLLEAMACGIACVSTDVGGAKAILDDGRCGLLVKSNDVDEFADAIIRLASDPIAIQHFGKAARHRVVSNYSIRAIGESYIDLYNNVLNNW